MIRFLVALLLLITTPTLAKFPPRGGAPNVALVEIGAGITLVNNGSTGTNVPKRFGFAFARGDMPLGNTLVVQDDVGNVLPAQLDQIATRTGMPGATDTPGLIHAAISVIEPSWTGSAAHTFHLFRTSGSYTPGAGLPTSALTGAHDFQVLFSNVKDGDGNVIGSGNFTCDDNAAIALGARTGAGGFDKTYDGAVQTTYEALAVCTDNATGLAQGQLVAEFYNILWQTTPGSGTLGNVELAVRLELPWQDQTSTTAQFMFGDAEVYDATTSTVLRSYSSTTNFAPADVNVVQGTWPVGYLGNYVASCPSGCAHGSFGSATVAGTSFSVISGTPFFAAQAGVQYINIAPGAVPITSATWANTSGGQLTVNVSNFNNGYRPIAGDSLNISGATNTGSGGSAAINTNFTVIVSNSPTSVVLSAPAATGVFGTIGGSPTLNFGVGCTAGGYLIQTFNSSTNVTLASSPGNCTTAPWNVGGGTIANKDNIQTSEVVTFAATGGGTLPLGLSICTPCFAGELTVGNVPGPIAVSRNAAPTGTAYQDFVTIASQGSCPSGSCLTTTRHTGLDMWTAADLMADDKGHPFWIGSNVAQIYPALTTAQLTYCETTALCPPFIVSGGVATPQNPYQVMSTAGGPLYRSHSLGPQENGFDGGGNHIGLGNWGDVAATWFDTQSIANWDILRALALTQSNAYAHVVLNQATGYMSAYDNGPYGIGGSYSKLGAGQTNAWNLDQAVGSGTSYNQFSTISVPSGINSTKVYAVGTFYSGTTLGGGNTPQSHEPDYGNAAVYTFTGDPWNLRALQMQANFSVLSNWPESPLTNNLSRNLTIGAKTYYGKVFNSIEQPRGPAWAFRAIEQAAVLGSDSDWNRALIWSYFEENEDVLYDYVHNVWAATDPNFETFGEGVDWQNSYMSIFMLNYWSGVFSEAHAKTHYVSSQTAGASSLYAANLGLQQLVPLWTSMGTTNGLNGQPVCDYWAPVEEGAPFQYGTTSAVPSPGTPPVITSISGYGVSGDVPPTWRSATVSAGGVFTPDSHDATGNELIENGDEIWAIFIGLSAAVPVFGTTHYFAVNVTQGASPNFQVSTTSPLTQACSATTGSTGCPAAFVPGSGLPLVGDFAWRPQACPAAPSAPFGGNTDPAGYVALARHAFINGLNAGATVPNLSTALSNANARYNPSAGNYTKVWTPWYDHQVTIP